MDAEEDNGDVVNVPYVEVDGIRFYSDRFYLNRTVSDPDQPQYTTSCFSIYNRNCTCGSHKPPPLLDREKLIASLDLKATLLASYNINLSRVAKEFPSLCGPKATVPTLVLHGQKGLARYVESAKNDDDDSSVEDIDVDMVPEAAGRKSQTLRTDHILENLGPNFSLSEVLPRWLPPKDRPPKSLKGSWRQMFPKTKDKRITKRGVHHPKYMILFCKDNSVIVLVSTGNLTSPSSTDGTWLQRFGPANKSNSSMSKSVRRKNGADFGAVLANFLQNQSFATRDGDILPEEFLEQYMDFKSLDDLETRYDYTQAQVHLIATCPGDYEGRFMAKHLRSDGHQREFLYGRQRIADIISRLSSATDEKCSPCLLQGKWFPEALMSEHDRLIFQPTSFGASFTRRDMADIIRSYLGHDETKKKARESPPKWKRRRKSWLDHEYSDARLLERLDIVWPSQRLLDAVGTSRLERKQTTSPRAVSEIDADLSLDVDDNLLVRDNSKGPRRFKSGSVFMSSQAFNSIDLSCLAQMVQYEPSFPEQREPLSPHIKSVARLFEGDSVALRNEFGIKKAENYFSWFLLTSACLSHGAQGQMAEEVGMEGTLRYANFELGVMFNSRLMGPRETDRLYCWKPQCSCPHSTSTREGGRDTLIHLPIPYAIHSNPYQVDKDVAEFSETPFFHEITVNSGRFLQLTPLGQRLAASADGTSANGTVNKINSP